MYDVMSRRTKNRDSQGKFYLIFVSSAFCVLCVAHYSCCSVILARS